MTYQQQLNPWVIYKLLPNLENMPVNRFRRRNDADAYLKVLKQHQPTSKFEIVFESMKKEMVTPVEA